MNKAVVFQDFAGGWSTDPKVGIKDSQAFTQAFDFRKSPSQMSVLPGLTREDNKIVSDLVWNEVQTPDGLIYAVGDEGNIYRRSTIGGWSSFGKLGSSGAGLDYRKDTDAIYATSDKTVSLLYPISSGNPTLSPDKYAIAQSLYNNSTKAQKNVSAAQSGSVNTYTLKTAIIESDPNRRYFQSDIEPLMKVALFVTDPGTGDWTATIHDGDDNVLATKTVTNAALKAGVFNDFVFSSAPNGQVRLYVAPNARTYHIHLVSTQADGVVQVQTSGDFASADLQIWADRLIQTNNGLHPMQRFLQYECIGNGNYLSVWEPITDPPVTSSTLGSGQTTGGVLVEWRQHALVFPSSYEVCGLALQSEFIVVAAEKATNSTTNPAQAGILFFWDGLSVTYNYFLEIPEGSPQCVHTYENIVYYYAGGSWWAVTSATTQPIKIRTMPGTDTEFSGISAPITVYPYAATVRRGIQLMGFPSVTLDPNVSFGVYSWGSVDKNFPASFGYSYIVSTGSQQYTPQNNLQIGMVKNFDDVLHVSWRDTGGCGVDVITNSSKPAAYAKWQSLIIDNNFVAKPKYASYLYVYYDLPVGATIQLGYSIDRQAFVVDPILYSSTNLWQGQPNKARFDIPQGRFHEFQAQLEVRCDETVTTPPVIRMVAIVYNDAREELL